MQLNGVDVFREVGRDAVEAEVNSSVVGWDDHGIYSQRLRNYTERPIEVEIRRTYPGHIAFRSELAPRLYDFQTVEFTVQVDAGAKRELPFEVVQHQGRNAKQNNVTLQNGKVAP